MGWSGELGRGGRRGLVSRLPPQTAAAASGSGRFGRRGGRFGRPVADSGFLVADSGFSVASSWWPIRTAAVADSGLGGGRFGPHPLGHSVHIGKMKKWKLLHWGYIGMMDKKIETTTMGLCEP